MSGLELTEVKKSFGHVDVIHGVDLSIDNGEFTVFVGPSGCGKSTLLRLVAGLEETTGGRDPHRRHGRHPCRAGRPRRRHGLPVLRALSAHDGGGEHGLRPEDDRPSEGRDQAPGQEGLADPASRQPARPQAEGALRRPAPARGDRPGDRARAAGVPVRRAAVQPRRRAARADAPRDRQAPQGAGGDDDLRHPRPGRGDDARRQDRRAAGPAASSRSARRSNFTTTPTTCSSPASSARRR